MAENLFDFLSTQGNNQSGFNSLSNYVMQNPAPNGISMNPVQGDQQNPFQVPGGNYDFSGGQQGGGFDWQQAGNIGAQGLNLFNSLNSIYSNFQAQKQQKQAFRFNRDNIQANFNNQVESYNNQVEERGRSRMAASKDGTINGYDSLDSYVSANSVNADISGSYKRNKQSQKRR